MISVVSVVASLALFQAANQRLSVCLVPQPTSIQFFAGEWRAQSIKVASAVPIAEQVASALVNDLSEMTGIKAIQSVETSKANLVLAIGGSGDKESYKLEIGERVKITAPSTRGLARGAATFLQLAKPFKGGIYAPKLLIADRPAVAYRGLMIDVARRFHSIDTLKQCVLLCSFYKIGFLQLHLTDDQSFTFPSKAFPAINGANQHGGPSYTHDELEDLVQFADARGVTIIPEIDVPGHSATLNRTMPELFKVIGTTPYEHHATINFANEKVLRAIDALIGELCEVFKSSPYIHMGGDEADITYVDQHPDFKALFKKLGLPDHSQHELYRRFLNQLNAMVKRRGKKLIVWEGFGRDPRSKFPIEKDILVMEFENAYYLPKDLLDDGYTLINASWTPLYVVNRHVWPAEKVYEWSLTRFGRFGNRYPATTWFDVPSAKGINGAQICSWEGPESIEIQNLRRIVPALAERLWNGNGRETYADFARRASEQDNAFSNLVSSVKMEASALDAKDPNGFDVPCFTKPLTITLSARREGEIRYTLDGSSPTTRSPLYAKPFQIQATTMVRAAAFDSNGKRIGFECSGMFYFVPLKIPNLATEKKATASGGTQGPQTPNLAIDDDLDHSSSWWAAPAPQWLEIDLGSEQAIGRIEVFPYWDGRRYYQYTVSISLDGEKWTQIADRSMNTTPASAQGDEIRFPVQRARFVRVNMLKGSANEGVHLVEVRVWPPQVALSKR